MDSKRTVIKVEGLEKVFNGEVRAVDSVSFEVLEGEVFGFLGPNGAGKTTTIAMLTTLTMPTGGRAEVLGHDIVTDADGVRKGIGLVPQELTLDDELTGRENLALQATLYHVPPGQARSNVDEVLALVGLADAADRPVKTYSGGMKKRLELANGLVHRPRVLFLDEPTLGLDVQTRSVIWEYIRRLKSETNMTIFLTTHYLEEADLLCDRIGIVDHGRLIALDTPEGLKRTVGGDIIDIEVDRCDDDLLAIIRGIIGIELLDGTCDGGRVRVKVPESGSALPVILSTLWKRGYEVVNVAVRKPSLDQAFLLLTGRELRDDAAPAAANGSGGGGTAGNKAGQSRGGGEAP